MSIAGTMHRIYWLDLYAIEKEMFLIFYLIIKYISCHVFLFFFSNFFYLADE